MQAKTTFAARAGRWSAHHAKTALGLWVAFVLVAVFVGQGVGLVNTDDASDGAGDSGRADRILQDAFPKAQRGRDRPDPGPEGLDRLQRAAAGRRPRRRSQRRRDAGRQRRPVGAGRRGRGPRVRRPPLGARDLQRPRRRRRGREGDRPGRARGPQARGAPPRRLRRAVRRRERRPRAVEGVRRRLRAAPRSCRCRSRC